MRSMNAFYSFVSLASLGLALLAACVGSSAQKQKQSPAPSPAKAERQDEQRPVIFLTFEKPRVIVGSVEWWPVEVVNITEIESGTEKGSWRIEIRNVSGKPIKSVNMGVESPNCEAFAMTAGLIIGLGTERKYFTKPTQPILEPGMSDVVIAPKKRLDRNFPPEGYKDCPPEKSYCYLDVFIVKYTDGTEWRSLDVPDDYNSNK